MLADFAHDGAQLIARFDSNSIDAKRAKIVENRAVRVADAFAAALNLALALLAVARFVENAKSLLVRAIVAAAKRNNERILVIVFASHSSRLDAVRLRVLQTLRFDASARAPLATYRPSP